MRDVRFAFWAEGNDFTEQIRRLEAPLIPEELRVSRAEANWNLLRSIGSRGR